MTGLSAAAVSDRVQTDGQNRGADQTAAPGDAAQFSATHSTGNSDIWIAGSGVGSDIWTAGSRVSDSGATAVRTASLRTDGSEQIRSATHGHRSALGRH